MLLELNTAIVSRDFSKVSHVQRQLTQPLQFGIEVDEEAKTLIEAELDLKPAATIKRMAVNDPPSSHSQLKHWKQKADHTTPNVEATKPGAVAVTGPGADETVNASCTELINNGSEDSDNVHDQLEELSIVGDEATGLSLEDFAKAAAIQERLYETAIMDKKEHPYHRIDATHPMESSDDGYCLSS